MLCSNILLRIDGLKKLSLIILIIGLSGCSKDECCVSKDITSSTVGVSTLNNCNDAVLNMQISSSEQYSIIGNQVEYDNNVIGTCHPHIDFTQQQLIIGHFYSKKNVLKFNYKFYKSCEPNFYKFVITPEYVDNGLNEETITYYYQILVPQIEKIDFLKVIFSEGGS
ncbi:MAG TPA: hypothetical protein VIK55_09795 [Paludibacter sp.]